MVPKRCPFGWPSTFLDTKSMDRYDLTLICSMTFKIWKSLFRSKRWQIGKSPSLSLIQVYPKWSRQIMRIFGTRDGAEVTWRLLETINIANNPWMRHSYFPILCPRWDWLDNVFSQKASLERKFLQFRRFTQWYLKSHRIRWIGIWLSWDLLISSNSPVLKLAYEFNRHNWRPLKNQRLDKLCHHFRPEYLSFWPRIW